MEKIYKFDYTTEIISGVGWNSGVVDMTLTKFSLACIFVSTESDGQLFHFITTLLKWIVHPNAHFGDKYVNNIQPVWHDTQRKARDNRARVKDIECFLAGGRERKNDVDNCHWNGNKCSQHDTRNNGLMIYRTKQWPKWCKLNPSGCLDFDLKRNRKCHFSTCPFDRRKMLGNMTCYSFSDYENCSLEINGKMFWSVFAQFECWIIHQAYLRQIETSTKRTNKQKKITNFHHLR